MQSAIAINIPGVQEQWYDLPGKLRLWPVLTPLFQRSNSGSDIWLICGMQRVQIPYQDMWLITVLLHNAKNGLHFRNTALLAFLVLPRFQVRCKERQSSSFPENLNLQESLGENRVAMIVRTKHRETAEPDYMILVDVVSFTNCQAHFQLLRKHLCIGKAPGLQQCYDIWLLLLYNAANERKTIFAASENIVAEDA
jgi:hypothetical protein